MKESSTPLTSLLRIQSRVIALSALVGLLIGLFDSLVDYLLFYHGSFLEILLTAVPSEEIWKRAVAMVVCLSFGVVVARVMRHRLQAERARAESEHQFQLLFEHAPDAIVVYDLKGRFIKVNRAAEELTGYNRSELAGKRFGDSTLLLAEQTSRAVENLAVSRCGKATGPEEFTIRRKDGQLVITEIRTYPVQLAAETTVLGIARDITERKRAEKEKSLLEEQLRQAQKMESIGRLAGGIAHDFNNLLTSIIGHAELGMMREKSQGPQSAELQEIISSGHRAAQLTRQLLTFSRKQVVTPVVLNLNETVVRLERMLHRLIREDVHIVTTLEAALDNVRADPLQMEQMVMNLAVNARDAMPMGGQITIETANVILDEEYGRTHSGVQPGPHVLLAVSDTGHGMSSEVQKHIYEPFFTTKETGQGTGLGLSTVYGIVNQHGGTISFYSEEGRGTTFRVYLPSVSARVEHTGIMTEDGDERRGEETILLVEDQEVVRQLVQRILSTRGYSVLVARDGYDALKIMGQRMAPVDLLLTDVIMPGMNGRELYERLTAFQPDLRVIYMSGYTDDVILPHGMLDAGTTFLQKPISVHVLTRKVREVLDRKVSK